MAVPAIGVCIYIMASQRGGNSSDSEEDFGLTENLQAGPSKQQEPRGNVPPGPRVRRDNKGKSQASQALSNELLEARVSRLEDTVRELTASLRNLEKILPRVTTSGPTGHLKKYDGSNHVFTSP